MPKIRQGEDKWRCSWDCGFQHTRLRAVVEHEVREHPEPFTKETET